MEHKIIAVSGVAEELGIAPGDLLLSINGEQVRDVVDYEYFTSDEFFTLLIQKQDGSLLEAEVEKDPWEPMGLTFSTGLMSGQRACANHCVFCFVDQLPPSARTSMRFKDDDWRLSFFMGNFVTLTNVGPRELQRIVERRVSPLYISVHATDPALRAFLLGRKEAPILPQLEQLANAGLSFHCQAVLCPGLNDGPALERTIQELFALSPNALSLAVVPVGLTAYRQGLSPLRPYTEEEARAVVQTVEAWQARCLEQAGGRFVFASDEFYCKAKLPVPPAEAYEGFPQIENGVGLMAKFAGEWEEAQPCVPVQSTEVSLATGESSCEFMQNICNTLLPKGVRVRVYPIRNRYFGGYVTVSGLVCGSDLIRELKGKPLGERLLLPDCMLRREEDVFLDNTTLGEVEQALGVPLEVIEVSGYALAKAFGAKDTEDGYE